jgi:two-component system response regulator NreC
VSACPARDSAPLRVALADDHPVVRAGLRSILHREGIEVVAEVGDGRTIVREVERLSPDVIVMDVSLPGLNGIDATRAIRRTRTPARVLLMSVHYDEPSVMEGLDAGASGYLLKDASGDELVRAVRAVAADQSYFSPAIARVLAHRAIAKRSGGVQLTPREREVVQLIGEGRRLREIASQMFLSPQTVKSHRANAMRKLGARTTAELVRYAIRSGLAPA